MPPVARAGPPREERSIFNITVPDQLLRYAAKAQLAKLPYSNNTVAALLGMDQGNFSKAIKHLSVRTAKQLDSLIIALAPDMDRVGGLDALVVRLRGLEDASGLGAHIPAPWTRELLKRPADDEFGVLTQASALLRMLLALQATPQQARAAAHIDIRQMVDRHREEIRRLVDRLILIGGSPPTPRNIDALTLLGSIGAYAFDLPQTGFQTGLNWALRERPLGFRTWRAVTKLVRLSKSLGVEPNELKDWVRRHLQDAEELRLVSLYPARSLDLELAINVPAEWSPPGDDWVGEVLLTRARNTHATVRERGTAALGLWERAVVNRQPDLAQVRGQLEVLVGDFVREAGEPGAATGLRWVAATVRHVLATDQAVCNSWPQVDEPCRRVVKDATLELSSRARAAGMPVLVLEDTVTLFEHALLQNAGVYRRQSVDTLVTGGWAEIVVPVLESVLKHDKAESWLRCRALFALGFLQVRNDAAARILRESCLRAYRNLANSDTTKSLVSEAHSALCAVADCFGATGAEEQARDIRRRLAPILRELVTDARFWDDEERYPVVRAAAYLLLVTAQPREDRTDLSKELLGELLKHPDEVTSGLSTWALQFRFADDGTIRPLHHAPFHTTPGTSPPRSPS